MKRIWCISDTHKLHDQLVTPDNIDIVIFAGDATNSYNSGTNANEWLNFEYWWNSLNIPTKIFVPGNHDTAIRAGLVKPKDHFLLHESKKIDGINFFGSPYTPAFGDWAFMVQRHKLEAYWNDIPENTDILITHGPPKGILDLSYSINGTLEFCGDKSLLNRVLNIKPKYHIFGHIHNSDNCINQGTRIYNGITFVNVSCVTDRKFNEGPSSNGVIIEI